MPLDPDPAVRPRRPVAWNPLVVRLLAPRRRPAPRCTRPEARARTVFGHPRVSWSRGGGHDLRPRRRGWRRWLLDDDRLLDGARGHEQEKSRANRCAEGSARHDSPSGRRRADRGDLGRCREDGGACDFVQTDLRRIEGLEVLPQPLEGLLERRERLPRPAEGVVRART